MKAFGGPFIRHTVVLTAVGCLAVVGAAGSVPGSPEPRAPRAAPAATGLPVTADLAQPAVDVAQPPVDETSPSSLGAPVTIASAAVQGRADLARAGSGSDVPAAALAAYQRAAAVLAKASPGCGIEWSLLAAVGRVESDHGRFADASLGADGVARPAIVGPVLDGSGSFSAVADTDAGRLDGDGRWDRAVGPMQFLPSTWSIVGVDGDGDGIRSPDDLDDAALAAAVYLCAGTSDLDRPGPMREALLRYNHSRDYAALVMAYEAAYRAGRYTVPGVSVSAAAPPSVLVGATIRPLRNATHAGAASVTDPHRAAGRPRGGRTHGAGPGARPDGRGPNAAGSPRPGGLQSARPSPSGVPLSQTQSGRQPTTPSAGPSTTAPSTAAPSTAAPSTGVPSTTPTPNDPPTTAPSTTPPPSTTPTPSEPPSTTPTPNEPPSTAPTPSDPASTTPTPSDPASTAPTPSDPATQRGPSATSLTGVWRVQSDGYHLDGTRLDAGSGVLLAAVGADYDGDGTRETVATELAGLVGTTVTATGQQAAAGWVLLSVNGVQYSRAP